REAWALGIGTDWGDSGLAGYGGARRPNQCDVSGSKWPLAPAPLRPMVTNIARARRKIGPQWVEERMGSKREAAALRGLTKDLGAAGWVVFAVLAVAGIGTMLAAALPKGADTAWMLAGSYLAPAALAFLAAWL